MDYEIDRIIGQRNLSLLKDRACRFIDMYKDDMLRIQTRDKSLDIACNQRIKLYELTGQILRPNRIVITRKTNNIYCRRLRGMIARLFDIRKDDIIAPYGPAEYPEVLCPKCGGGDVEAYGIDLHDPRAECFCSKCNYDWIEQ